MVGKATLLESAALVSRADQIIGVDTGLTHMGWAFKVPTIALFGSTCPYRDLRGLRGAVLYKNMTCSPCRRKPVCGGSYDCLAELHPDSVLESMAGLARDKAASNTVVAS
jgi:heptosyltransferase-1